MNHTVLLNKLRSESGNEYQYCYYLKAPVYISPYCPWSTHFAWPMYPYSCCFIGIRTVVWMWHGPLARYVKLRVARAPGMPGKFSAPPWVSDPHMHHGTCVTHVPWCMPGSLTRGFLWSWWRGKLSQHSRSMRHQRFYVFGKRPMHQTQAKYSKWRRLCKTGVMYISLTPGLLLSTRLFISNKHQ